MAGRTLLCDHQAKRFKEETKIATGELLDHGVLLERTEQGGPTVNQSTSHHRIRGHEITHVEIVA